MSFRITYYAGYQRVKEWVSVIPSGYRYAEKVILLKFQILEIRLLPEKVCQPVWIYFIFDFFV